MRSIVHNNHIVLAATVVIGLSSVAASAQNDESASAYRPAPQGMTLNLAKPFHTRSAWRLVVTEGAPVKDYGDSDAPGALTLCLHKGPTGPCISDPVTPPSGAAASNNAPAWEAHYVIATKVVYPRGPKAAPFLEIITGSLNSGDGDQVVYTQLLKYDVERDTFRRVFSKGTGRNNNEEIRLCHRGAAAG